jgi:hypothetical protein
VFGCGRIQKHGGTSLGIASIGTLASLEINPLITHEQGATGVDALIASA